MDDLKLYSQREKGLDSLVQAVSVFREYIGMEFGIEKCAMLVMEKGEVSWYKVARWYSYQVITGR